MLANQLLTQGLKLSSSLKALLDKGSKTSIKLQEAKEYIKQLLKKLKK